MNIEVRGVTQDGGWSPSPTCASSVSSTGMAP
jgi:hypothetical protein